MKCLNAICSDSFTIVTFFGDSFMTIIRLSYWFDRMEISDIQNIVVKTRTEIILLNHERTIFCLIFSSFCMLSGPSNPVFPSHLDFYHGGLMSSESRRHTMDQSSTSSTASKAVNDSPGGQKMPDFRGKLATPDRRRRSESLEIMASRSSSINLGVEPLVSVWVMLL